MTQKRQSICRTVHDKNYTTVNNHICKDKSLSYKAKGIWLYAFSRPDDWQFYESDIAKQSNDGKYAVKAGLNELERAGYLVKEKAKDEKNRFVGWDYIFYEKPIEVQKKFPKREKPNVGESRDRENQPLLSTDLLPSTERKPNTQSSSLPSSSKCQDIDDDDEPDGAGEVFDLEEMKGEVGDISYTTTSGHQEKISRNDIYLQFLNKPYSTETLRMAIKRTETGQGPINNIIKYIEAACKQIDSQRANKRVSEKKENNPKKKQNENVVIEEELVTFAELAKRKRMRNV